MKLNKSIGSTCAILLLAASAQGQLVDKTPKLHLSFDNVSGSTVLNGGSGGAAMNGTLNGGASIVSGGRFGNCLQVTGANSWDASCRVPNAVVPLHVQAGSAWTVAVWIKTTTQGGTWAYQGDGGWAQGHTTFAMVVNNGTGGVNGPAAGGVRHSSGWQQGTTPVNDGNWHHVVVTCNGTTKVQYIDGVVDTWVANQWNNSTATGNQFWIGGAGTGQNDGQVGLEGLVDEAYVFDQALSASDVQQLYNNNTVPKVPVSVTLTPNNGYRGQAFTVTATATPTVGVVTNAKINLSAIGLSATANLVQSSPNVFTNTFTVPNNTNATIGAALLTATVISTEPLIGSGGATFTVKALPPTNAIVLAQLTNTTVYQYTEASFRFGTTNDAPNQAPWPMTYSWYKNGVLVSTNPMGSSYTFLTVPDDNGAQIQAIARVADTNYSSISVTSAVVTLTLTTGTPEYPGLKQEFFAGASRADAEIGNVARGVVGVVTNADSAGGLGDNHVRRYSGYFIPPTTDGYVFFLASDDDCDLFLSTDANPVNKRLIAQETSWSGTRGWQSGNSILSQKRSDQWTNSVGVTPYAPGINLTAGQKYYIEAVMHNGGGGDNWAMTYQTLTELAADGTQPLEGSASRMTVESNNIVFATFAGTTLTWSVQPQPVTVYEGTGTNFSSLAVSDAELSPLYQWYLNTGSGYTAISGATGPNLSLGTIPVSYNGAQVRVVANIPLSSLSITSAPATISVIQSVTEVGFLKLERWNGASLAQLRSGSLGTPNFTMAITAFGGSVDNPGGQNNFGRRISGYFIPATTGDYVFFTTGDDETDLFVSTDATPANKRLVCQNAGWNNGSLWAWGAVGGGGASASQMRSDQWSPDGGTTVPYQSGIHLTAGQKYYIEQLFHQGGGGANNAATFKLTTDPDPVAGQETRLKGNLIAMSAIRCNTVDFTQQPANANSTAMGYATFSADGTTDSTVQIGSIFGYENPQAGYLFFQWYKNGVAIPGANSKTITLGPLLPTDNGAQIYCSMRALGFANNALTPIWTNSVTATISISGQSVFEPGVAWVNWWSNTTSRVAVENGSAGQPTYSFVSPSFESPWNGASWDNYVNRVHAYFTPTNNDSFVFFVNSDDDSSLFISSNSDPASKFLIAQETGWSNPLNWVTAGGGGSTTTQKRSDQWSPDGGATVPYQSGIAMTAGQKYWLEAVHHDGAFGDNFAATYKSYSEGDPANGTRSRLTGNLIGTYVPRTPWVAFLQQPVSQSVTSGGNPVTFSVQGTNPPSIWVGTAGNPNDWLANPPTLSLQYQWYKNGTPIPGATSSSYTLPFVLTSDQGAQFVCAMRALGYADNSLNRIFSNSLPAVLTVVTDTAPPTITYAAAFANTNQPHFVVSVTFSEWMNLTTLSNAANYSIAGVTITNISVDVNNRTVRLLVNQMPTLPLNLTVNGVKDLTGNTIANNSSAPVNSEKLIFTDVGIPGGDPAYPTFVSVTGNGGYIISAQGSDIWNTADAFNYAWELKTNNFDVVVRGVSQGHTHDSAKAGLMVRETLDTFSRNWGVFNNPAPDSSSSVGANNIEANMRDTVGGATASWKNLAGNIAPAYPNAWLRLKRTGNVLEAFASSNMVNWVALGRYDTSTNVNGALMSEVYVGLATSAHGNDTLGGPPPPPFLFYNAAQYADYSSSFVPSAPPAQLTISRSGSNVTISWTPTGGHLEWSPALAGPGVNWQSLGTSNPAIVPIGTGPQFFRVVNP